MSDANIKVVACNLAVSKSPVSRGSLAYVVQLAGDRLLLLARSRGGRWIEIWAKVSDCANFRFKSVWPEHPLRSRIGFGSGYLSEDFLADLASRGAGQGLDLRRPTDQETETPL